MSSLLQPYAAQHQHLAGPGDSRPTAKQVIIDQGVTNQWASRVIFITGGTSAIGRETALALLTTGARIYITSRSGGVGPSDDDLSTHANIHLLPLSLDSLASVRACAAEFLRREQRLDVLILNAGIMACPFGRTQDGFETQFGTNHLGHFLLFRLLEGALAHAASTTPGHTARVIALSSSAHRGSEPDGLRPALDANDFSFSNGATYNPVLAYARSKLANIYFAHEVSRRYRARGIAAFAVHPGSIKSALQQYLRDTEYYKAATQGPAYQAQVKTPAQGAATTVWAATAPPLSARPGAYLENVGESGPAQPGVTGYGVGYSPAAAGRDADERRLWDISEVMCGLAGQD